MTDAWETSAPKFAAQARALAEWAKGQHKLFPHAAAYYREIERRNRADAKWFARKKKPA